MAGEGVLPPQAPGWDQRPGALEATRVDSLPVVAGRREADGWKVWISAGGICAVLDPARARALAVDILGICDVVGGVNGSLVGPSVSTLLDTNGEEKTFLRQAQDERVYTCGMPAPGSHEDALDRAMLIDQEAEFFRRRPRPDGQTDDPELEPC